METEYEKGLSALISGTMDAAAQANSAAANAQAAAMAARDAEEAARDAAADILAQRDAGLFKGDKGDKGDPGEPGGNGVVTQLDPGMFGMHVDENGHLILTHNDNEPAPPLSIEDGDLIYTIS